jgi:hypothetical protein
VIRQRHSDVIEEVSEQVSKHGQIDPSFAKAWQNLFDVSQEKPVGSNY